MTVGRKISTVRQVSETSDQGFIDHHFYQVSFAGDELVPISPEVIRGAFFSLANVEAIRHEGKLFFAVEDSLYAEALRAEVSH